MKVVEYESRGKGKHKVAVIELSGPIRSRRKGEQDIVREIELQFQRASQDQDVCGVILEISSPGGEVVATDLIYNIVARYRQKRFVVAYIRDIGASGAYYVACATDKIMAHPSAIVGSIGVVMQFMHIEGLLEKIGVKSEAITSGKRKDSGSPFRAMSEEEKQYFKGMVDAIHQKFANLVADRRHLDPQAVTRICDGRVMLAEEAVREKLIDGTAYLEGVVDAIPIVVQARLKISIPSVKMVRYGIKRPRPLLARFLPFSASSNPLGEVVEELLSPSARFLYLWQ